MKKKQILFFACCLALGSSTMDLCAQRTMDKLRHFQMELKIRILCNFSK
ncbi:hypothetical protein [Paraprevotella clara]